MPPKAKVEVAAVVDIPDQPPALDSDGFLDDLLSKARCDNLAAVEAGVVHTLGLPNYRCNLRQGILVDFHVECIAFLANHGCGPKKALSVLSWLNAMRKSIEEHRGDDTAAREMFKQFLVSNTERYLRESAPQDNEASQAAEAQAAAAAAALAVAGKKDAKPAKGPAPPATKQDESPGASAARGSENPYVSSSEAAALATFVSRGLLQHARLFAYVAAQDRPVVCEAPKTFTFAVETPIRVPALAKAMTSADVEASHKALEAKAQEELQRLQAEEAAVLEAQRRAEELRREEERKRDEEERANRLYFSKAGTGPAIEMVQQDVEHQLSQRQRDILARISKLEADVSQLVGK